MGVAFLYKEARTFKSQLINHTNITHVVSQLPLMESGGERNPTHSQVPLLKKLWNKNNSKENKKRRKQGTKYQALHLMRPKQYSTAL